MWKTNIMKGFRHAFYLLLISIFSFHCQKELSFKAGGAGEVPGSGPVRATIQGNIVDEDEQPVGGAIVRAGARTLNTDTKGYFRITNSSLDRSASLVTVEKDGY